MSNELNNWALFREAEAIANETGMTPRQMQERIKELEKSLEVLTNFFQSKDANESCQKAKDHLMSLCPEVIGYTKTAKKLLKK